VEEIIVKAKTNGDSRTRDTMLKMPILRSKVPYNFLARENVSALNTVEKLDNAEEDDDKEDNIPDINEMPDENKDSGWLYSKTKTQKAIFEAIRNCLAEKPGVWIPRSELRPYVHYDIRSWNHLRNYENASHVQFRKNGRIVEYRYR
jgi:hypothetical protein